MDKNEFAEKVMATMNNELLQHERGCPQIELGDYSKNGDRIFLDPEEGDKFGPEDIFHWFNVLCHDEDWLNDNMITNEMFKIHKEAVSLGFITEDTPKHW
jgi:hypothetical protein